MSTVPQKHSRGNSQIAKVDREALTKALNAKTPLEGFAKHPTIAMAVRSMGESEVLVMMTARITKAFVEYFSEEQRMDPNLHGSFAETIIEDYPHESPADVVLFIKYAARGRYGETKEVKDRNGDVIRREVVNKGKTYGRLTSTLAMDWFRQYLEEKATAIETARRERNKAMNSAPTDDRLLEAMKIGHATGRKEEDVDTGRRVNLLLRTVGHMGVERLRHAWRKAKTERERIIILQEANRRGLVEQHIQNHLNKSER